MLKTVADMEKTELLHWSAEIHSRRGPLNIYPLHAPDEPLNPKNMQKPHWNYVFQLQLVISPLVFFGICLPNAVESIKHHYSWTIWLHKNGLSHCDPVPACKEAALMVVSREGTCRLHFCPRTGGLGAGGRIDGFFLSTRGV